MALLNPELTDESDDFWKELLDSIEWGNVIPVIGEHVVTFGDGNDLLYPWLALELAKLLDVNATRLAATPTLNDVTREYLLAGGDRKLIYLWLSSILRDRCPMPGGPLRALAQITGFNLYLTTTIDPLLEHALNAERFGGAAGTRNGVLIVGRSAVGRATVGLLKMNAADRRRLRER